MNQMTQSRLAARACACAFMLGLVACGSTPPDVNPAPIMAQSDLERDSAPVVSDDDRAALASGNAAFAYRFYDVLRAQDDNARNNVFFSPTSISLALSMCYAGARGTTATEMASALEFRLPNERLLSALNALDLDLQTRGKTAFEGAREVARASGEAPPPESDFRLHIVNSLWGDKTLTFEKPFLDALARNFGAGVRLADFRGNPDAERARINAWVSTETQDKIRDLLPSESVSPSTRAVIVNAIHMKMPWAFPFSTTSTADRAFAKADGAVATMPFMEATASYRYIERDGVEALAIPLTGEQVSLVVVMPKAGELAAFEAMLATGAFESLFASMNSELIDLRLPKVSFTSPSLSLVKAFNALGMKTAFTEAADLSAMAREPLRIDDIFHKATVVLDENGLEAAAASAVVMLPGSAPAATPRLVTINRPFFMSIYDAPSKTVLFAGHVNNPAAN